MSANQRAATAAPDLLRVYFDPAEIGPDGYPLAWHRPTPYFATADIRAERIADDPATGDWRVRMSQEAGIMVWPAVKDLVREQAGHRCVRCGHPYPPGIALEHPRGEWTPCDKRCTHGGPVRWLDADGMPRPGSPRDPIADDAVPVGFSGWQAQWRILTVHHLNGIKTDCRWWILAALCQRCHLTIQAKVYMERPYDRPHTEWFKPHAAGYYASVQAEHVGGTPDPPREWVLEHMDEILAEHATQGTLL